MMSVIFSFAILLFNIVAIASSGDSLNINEITSKSVISPNNCYESAVFRFVDRFSDNNQTFKIKVSEDNFYYIGDFKIKVFQCCKSPKNKEKENAAAIELFEKEAKNYKKSFSGWLFSENFFLTNIEHPRYDLRLVDCAK